MRLEASTERCGKEDEQRHKAFSDSAAGRLGIGDNVRKKAFHAFHAQAGQDFTQTLSSTLTVNAGRISLECAQQSGNEIGEVHLSKSLDECSKCLGGSSTSFRDRID